MQVVEARNVKQARQQAAAGERMPRPQLDEALRCPRCDSRNTKFCYYNNDSMLQPRYLCKACRRYWTQGGSLRNVPVGGGCCKNKRSSSALLASSSSNSIVKQHLVPASSTAEQDFPNVLPTFMSTGINLPRTPFAPLSLSNPAPAPPLDSSSFLDMLRGGGFLGDHQGNNSFIYRPTSSSMETSSSSGFGNVMQHGVVVDHGGSAAPIACGHGSTTAAISEGGQQWPTTTCLHMRLVQQTTSGRVLVCQTLRGRANNPCMWQGGEEF